MNSIIIDTNIIVSLVRNEGFKQKFEERYFSKATDLYTSVVVQGELESLAMQWGWGTNRRYRMEETLSKITILPIKTRPILTAYARIDAYSQGKLDGKPLPQGISARNMGKNDLWIAATAHAASATLVTTDNDFDHLRSSFIGVDWVDIKVYF